MIENPSDADRPVSAIGLWLVHTSLHLLLLFAPGGIMRATSIAIVATGLLIQPCGVGRQPARAADQASAAKDAAEIAPTADHRPAGRERQSAAEPAPQEVSGPLSPAESQRQFVLPKGLKIELVAAEPDVQSPVAMAFDQNGRMFVVEMLDYPNGPAPGSLPEGRIRLLEDRDAAGRYRASSVFAEKLLFANGVMPWRDGLIVTSAPRIVWLRDTRNVGRADQSVPLYDGFATGNPQLRVSHPLLGPDNGVYVANGQQGGRIRPSKDPDAAPIDIGGRDFRFDPVSGRAEAVAGMGQFGNTFDDWGQRFVCTNRNHWIHTVLPERYLRRNPYLAPPPRQYDDQGPGGAAKIYPLTIQSTTSPEHRGSFTAACGVFVYRGRLLPAEYRDAIYTCEPTGNLIHQEILLPKGATFVGHPAQNGREFLASRDNWFRPVFITHGPDRAMYVVDFYRKIIEHPEWLPKELKNSPDLLAGKERGRIWRIVPEGAAAPVARPQLGKASTTELVALLEHPEPWYRTTAQRLLLERQDPADEKPLRKLVVESPQPVARLHAAWLLEQRGGLDKELVLVLLKHPHPRVRQHGLVLAEHWLATDAAIQQRALALAVDDDPQLRFQAALSLGAWDDDRVLLPLIGIALAQVDDPWTRLAVQTAVPRRAGALLSKLLGKNAELLGETTADRLKFVSELAALVGGRQEPREVGDVLEAAFALVGLRATAWQMAVRRGLAEGVARRNVAWSDFLAKLPPERQPLVAKLNALLEGLIKIARTASAHSPERLEAVGALAQVDWKNAEPVLRSILRDDADDAVRLAAVRAAAAHSQPEVAGLLVKSWAGLPPSARRATLEALLSRPERTLVLLDELEAGRIDAADLDAARRFQLLNHRRSDVRERARRIFETLATPERKDVLAKYQAALRLDGDPRRGWRVFQKAICAACHRVGNLGVAVGPDISDTRTKTPAALLVDILDPNAAIDANYFNYLVALKDGRSLSGILAAEAATSITLRRADGQTDTVLRNDIEDNGIFNTTKSLMPEGLEKNLSLQDMSDLLAFLKHWRETE